VLAPLTAIAVESSLVRQDSTIDAATVDGVAGALLAAYARVAAGRSYRQVSDPSAKIQAQTRGAAKALLAVHMSPEAYVDYVFATFRKRQGKRPYFAQVIGRKAVAGWIRDYQRNSVGSGALPVPMYVMSAERKDAYKKRFKA
jgi:hypothetical protein